MRLSAIKTAILAATAMVATTGLAKEETKQSKFLSEIRRGTEAEAKSARSPAAKADARSETEQQVKEPVGSQISFVEISPMLGTISIQDKSVFSVGANLSFPASENSRLYFEPSIMASFLGGDANENTTIFHIDAGLRYDLVIEGSALVPFFKLAAGPSLSSQSNVTVDGEEVSDSYLNAFVGGGLRVLISPRIAARVDTGLTFQATDPGLYVAGAAVFPL